MKTGRATPSLTKLQLETNSLSPHYSDASLHSNPLLPLKTPSLWAYQTFKLIVSMLCHRQSRPPGHGQKQNSPPFGGSCLTLPWRISLNHFHRVKAHWNLYRPDFIKSCSRVQLQSSNRAYHYLPQPNIPEAHKQTTKY